MDGVQEQEEDPAKGLVKMWSTEGFQKPWRCMILQENGSGQQCQRHGALWVRRLRPLEASWVWS